MDKEKFLTEDFSVLLVFGGLFATFESISAVLTLAFSLLGKHPSVLQELSVRKQRKFEPLFNVFTAVIETLMIDYLSLSG
jgi:cytochrome P450